MAPQFKTDGGGSEKLKIPFIVKIIFLQNFSTFLYMQSVLDLG